MKAKNSEKDQEIREIQIEGVCQFYSGCHSRDSQAFLAKLKCRLLGDHLTKINTSYIKTMGSSRPFTKSVPPPLNHYSKRLIQHFPSLTMPDFRIWKASPLPTQKSSHWLDENQNFFEQNAVLCSGNIMSNYWSHGEGQSRLIRKTNGLSPRNQPSRKPSPLWTRKSRDWPDLNHKFLDQNIALLRGYLLSNNWLLDATQSPLKFDIASASRNPPPETVEHKNDQNFGSASSLYLPTRKF